MTTEEPLAPRVPEPNWASYIDTLRISGTSRRPRESGIADAASIEARPKISDEPVNWAEWIDRIYIEELMRRLGH
jgi:hypothetical protein